MTGKCPKCREEIEYLYCDTEEEARYTFDGRDYTTVDVYTKSAYFSCPHCSETLTDDSDEAAKILRVE